MILQNKRSACNLVFSNGLLTETTHFVKCVDLTTFARKLSEAACTVR